MRFRLVFCAEVRHVLKTSVLFCMSTSKRPWKLRCLGRPMTFILSIIASVPRMLNFLCKQGEDEKHDTYEHVIHFSKDRPSYLTHEWTKSNSSCTLKSSLTCQDLRQNVCKPKRSCPFQEVRTSWWLRSLVWFWALWFHGRAIEHPFVQWIDNQAEGDNWALTDQNWLSNLDSWSRCAGKAPCLFGGDKLMR